MLNMLSPYRKGPILKVCVGPWENKLHSSDISPLVSHSWNFRILRHDIESIELFFSCLSRCYQLRSLYRVDVWVDCEMFIRMWNKEVVAYMECVFCLEIGASTCHTTQRHIAESGNLYASLFRKHRRVPGYLVSQHRLENRSQWPRGLTHEPSWPARTLGY
jgi:hypothetical protein